MNDRRYYIYFSVKILTVSSAVAISGSSFFGISLNVLYSVNLS
jgi:hypothetical protein